MTGERVIHEDMYGDPRVVAGVTVQVWKLDWSHGGVSYDVLCGTDDENLTEHGSFDTVPTDEQIRDLLIQYIGFWCCQGCGASYHTYEVARILNHSTTCELHAFHAEVVRQNK